MSSALAPEGPPPSARPQLNSKDRELILRRSDPSGSLRGIHWRFLSYDAKHTRPPELRGTWREGKALRQAAIETVSSSSAVRTASKLASLAGNLGTTLPGSIQEVQTGHVGLDPSILDHVETLASSRPSTSTYSQAVPPRPESTSTGAPSLSAASATLPLSSSSSLHLQKQLHGELQTTSLLNPPRDTFSFSSLASFHSQFAHAASPFARQNSNSSVSSSAISSISHLSSSSDSSSLANTPLPPSRRMSIIDQLAPRARLAPRPIPLSEFDPHVHIRPRSATLEGNPDSDEPNSSPSSIQKEATARRRPTLSSQGRRLQTSRSMTLLSEVLAAVSKQATRMSDQRAKRQSRNIYGVNMGTGSDRGDEIDFYADESDDDAHQDVNDERRRLFEGHNIDIDKNWRKKGRRTSKRGQFRRVGGDTVGRRDISEWEDGVVKVEEAEGVADWMSTDSEGSTTGEDGCDDDDEITLANSGMMGMMRKKMKKTNKKDRPASPLVLWRSSDRVRLADDLPPMLKSVFMNPEAYRAKLSKEDANENQQQSSTKNGKTPDGRSGNNDSSNGSNNDDNENNVTNNNRENGEEASGFDVSSKRQGQQPPAPRSKQALRQLHQQQQMLKGQTPYQQQQHHTKQQGGAVPGSVIRALRARAYGAWYVDPKQWYEGLVSKELSGSLTARVGGNGRGLGGDNPPSRVTNDISLGGNRGNGSNTSGTGNGRSVPLTQREIIGRGDINQSSKHPLQASQIQSSPSPPSYLPPVAMPLSLSLASSSSTLSPRSQDILRTLPVQPPDDALDESLLDVRLERLEQTGSLALVLGSPIKGRRGTTDPNTIETTDSSPVRSTMTCKSSNFHHKGPRLQRLDAMMRVYSGETIGESSPSVEEKALAERLATELPMLDISRKFKKYLQQRRGSTARMPWFLTSVETDITPATPSGQSSQPQTSPSILPTPQQSNTSTSSDRSNTSIIGAVPTTTTSMEGDANIQSRRTKTGHSQMHHSHTPISPSTFSGNTNNIHNNMPVKTAAKGYAEKRASDPDSDLPDLNNGVDAPPFTEACATNR